MWKWLAAGALALAMLPEGRGPEPDLDRSLFFATLEGLCEEAIPAEAVEAVLQKDEKGRYRHFVYACPVCSPVVEGFRAYGMRKEFYYSRKGDPLTGDRKTDGAAWVKDPATALHGFVGRCVDRHIRSRRLTEKEADLFRQEVTIGMKKGNSLLDQSEGFAHKSCPSCDGGSGRPWEPGK